MWLLALIAAALAAPEDEIVAALTPRHAAPSCDEIAPSWPADARIAAFVSVAEGVEAPPWVPVAAAACVAESAEDPVAFDAVSRWIGDPVRAGLALSAVARLDVLPTPIAERLADRALARGRTDARFDAWILPSLSGSAHETVRRKVAAPPP